ncbi:Uncharacterised protein PB.4097, partial [Pycnogonum litorale]
VNSGRMGAEPQFVIFDRDILVKMRLKISTHGRFIIFILAIMFTLLTALQNSGDRTNSRSIGPPQRFFPVTSLVIDYAYGNMVSMKNRIMDQELSFVMYYAPWDAKSMQAREEFEIAARYFHAQVFFAAINCWWNEGECYNIHTLKSFPVFVAYPVIGSGVEFKAPITAENMIVFLEEIMKPYKVIHRNQDLIDLRATCQSVFVAHFSFNLSPQPPGFHSFYSASYESLFQDSFQQICYGLVTNSNLAADLRIVSSPRLFLWNDTKKYPHKLLKVSDLHKWLNVNVHSLAHWISISGMKSTTLWKYLKKQDTLILFTPRNLLLKYSPYFTLLHYVMTQYMTCDSNNETSRILNSMYRQLELQHMKVYDIRKKCTLASLSKDFQKCHSYENKRKAVRCSVCFMCYDQQNASKCQSDNLNNIQMLQVDSTCSTSQSSNVDINCYDSNVANSKSPSNPLVTDDDRIREMIDNDFKTKCRTFKPNEFPNQHQEFLDDSLPVITTSVVEHLSGLGCETNKSLNVLALDSYSYGGFANNLGLNLSSLMHRTAAVILSMKDEMQYVLRKVTASTLVKFLVNFTDSSLSRYRRSSSKTTCDSSGEREVCIEEVTTENFSSVVLDDQKDVVLMYYSNWCGFCAGVAHIFLSAASYFNVSSNIVFARINGDKNDLQWQFTVSKYPSIFIFPSHGKSNSVQFPTDKQITVTHLIQFVLANVNDSVRREILVEKCSDRCLKLNLESASSKSTQLKLGVKILKA